MAFGDADLRERTIAPLAGEQECGDAGGIGLEGQDHHVEHELNVFLETGGDAGRRIHGGVGDILELFRPLDPVLDFSDAGQVFIELLLVSTTKLTLQGDACHRGQSPGSTAAARGGARGSCGARPASRRQKALEDQPGIGLRRQGHGGTAPGQVELVGAGIPGIAVAGLPHPVAGQFQ